MKKIQINNHIVEYDQLVEHEGKNLYMGLAFINGIAEERPHYTAFAVDENNIDYEIRWDVKDNYEEIEEEDQMCDWDKFSVKLI